MNDLEKILEEFDERFVLHLVESSHFETKWEQFNDAMDLPIKAKAFIKEQFASALLSERQRIRESLGEVIKRIEELAYFKDGKFTIVGGFYSNTEEKLRGPVNEEVELINKHTVLKLLNELNK